VSRQRCPHLLQTSSTQSPKKPYPNPPLCQTQKPRLKKESINQCSTRIDLDNKHEGNKGWRTEMLKKIASPSSILDIMTITNGNTTCNIRNSVRRLGEFCTPVNADSPLYKISQTSIEQFLLGNIV